VLVSFGMIQSLDDFLDSKFGANRLEESTSKLRTVPNRSIAANDFLSKTWSLSVTIFYSTSCCFPEEVQRMRIVDISTLLREKVSKSGQMGLADIFRSC
jgi:hypothetical protein